jgi:hypothetical protein
MSRDAGKIAGLTKPGPIVVSVWHLALGGTLERLSRRALIQVLISNVIASATRGAHHRRCNRIRPESIHSGC